MANEHTDPATLRSYDQDKLIHLLGDPLGAVRREAIHALGEARNPDERTIRALQHGLQDTYAPVAMYAAQALGRLKHAQSAPLIAPLVQHPDRAMRHYAVEALAEIGHRSAYDALVVAAEDKDRRISVTAIEGLRKIVRPEDDEVLAALQSRTRWTRRWRVERVRSTMPRSRRDASQTS